jgi:hypothetical protein
MQIKQIYVDWSFEFFFKLYCSSWQLLVMGLMEMYRHSDLSHTCMWFDWEWFAQCQRSWPILIEVDSKTWGPVWFKGLPKEFYRILTHSNFSYRGHLIQRIEPSKIHMDCFPIQCHRISSKRLDLLEKKIMCLWQLWHVLNLYRYFLCFPCGATKRLVQLIH